MVIVGNKLDLQEREVSREAIRDLAESLSTPVYETSAKRNWQVIDAFTDLCRQITLFYPSTTHPKKKRSKGRSTCVVM